MNIGEIKKITYTYLNLDNITIKSKINFISIDTTTQTIRVDTTDLEEPQTIDVVVGGDTIEGYDYGIIFFVNILDVNDNNMSLQ